jgi:L-threonylcarbamoyladenylate synthase
MITGKFEDDLKNSLKFLKEGRVILYPSDTIWGLGCDATNSGAVEKIFKIKERTESKSMIILVDGISMIERYVSDIPEIVFDLTNVTNTPLTIIYPEGKNLARGLCSKDGSIGIRICHDEFCESLIRRFRKPLVSTSANISGMHSPAFFGEIDPKILTKVDYVVKYRQKDRLRSVPSPVIKIDKNGVFKIIRM